MSVMHPFINRQSLIVDKVEVLLSFNVKRISTKQLRVKVNHFPSRRVSITPEHANYANLALTIRHKSKSNKSKYV